MALPQSEAEKEAARRMIMMAIRLQIATDAYKLWLKRVHDMPNADYQAGVKWFRERVEIVKRVQKEVADGKMVGT